MKPSVIQQVFKQFGKSSQSGSRLELGPHLEAQIFVALGSDALNVQKIAAIEVHDEFVLAVTSKGEQFFFSYEDVTGIKIEKVDEKKLSGGAGFTRA